MPLPLCKEGIALAVVRGTAAACWACRGRIVRSLLETVFLSDLKRERRTESAGLGFAQRENRGPATSGRTGQVHRRHGARFVHPRQD